MTLNAMEQLRQSSPFYGGNAPYLEALYDTYLSDPQAIDAHWRDYFAQLQSPPQSDVSHTAIKQQFIELARNKVLGAGTPPSASKRSKKQVPVTRLINAYRVRGHQQANLDPLGLMPRPFVPDLELKRHRLSEADLDTLFHVDLSITGKEEATLREIIAALDRTYCSTVGAEYMHIMNTKETRWLQKRLEKSRSHPDYPIETKIDLLNNLTAAEGLEKYLGTRYPGTKRFGLEGGESLIPMLDALVQEAGKKGVVEMVLGMAHRGRLNVLVNILGKNPADLFDEFEGKHNQAEKQSGDVKYHQGFSSNVMTPGGEMHLALTFNPSHLEIVSPVVEGSVRARQDRRGDPDGDKVMPVLVHGDAAFAAQGVVMETLQMSQTRGFYTGGTVHIVINNQIGFTTSNLEDARSTEYCTDVVKMIQAPILHVNGDDPEAVLFVTQLAFDYRMEFRKDIVIDLICYRRRGHNEADEPSATQPRMYQAIAKHPTTREIYAKKIIASDILSEANVNMLVDEYRKALETGTHVVKELVKEPDRSLFVDWSPYIGHPWTTFADTRVDQKTFQQIARCLETLPENFVQQKQVEKLSDDRRKMAEGTLPINWGFAEVMAYGTLLNEGHSIRITGQDVRRGTFSHRHVVRYNQTDGVAVIPLEQFEKEKAHFYIYDSLLSEEAVLAFEYGYATTAPNTLVIWEAQFGDFANGAQVVIDQFISSGEHKWGRLCGLTALLPHGYEGQGPEHSSARLERYLQLCAEHNMQVCIPSTPAQIFHLLRRQAIRPMRRPLIIMSPKSLLRHPLAISTVQELTEGGFATVIDEVDAMDAKKIMRVVMCSGKVYYDLLEKRRADKQTDTAIVRIEQLYPFPEKKLARVIGRYKNVQTVVWCQEEPKNQGAWYSSQHYMRKIIHQHDPNLYLHYAGRRRSAAAAVGHLALHIEQQKELVLDALTKK